MWQYFGILRVHHIVKKLVLSVITAICMGFEMLYVAVRFNSEETKLFLCFHFLFVDFRQFVIVY